MSHKIRNSIWLLIKWMKDIFNMNLINIDILLLDYYVVKLITNH